MTKENPLILVRVSQPFLITLPCHEGCGYSYSGVDVLGFKHIEVKLLGSRERGQGSGSGPWTELPVSLCWQCACLLAHKLKPEVKSLFRSVILLDPICPIGPHRVTVWTLSWDYTQPDIGLTCGRHKCRLVPKGLLDGPGEAR